MTHPQFDQEPPTSASKFRQRLIRLFKIFRRSAAWVWLLLVFGWYGLHGNRVPLPLVREGEISTEALTIAVVAVSWAVAWAGWWIWVVWPFPVAMTLTAAFLWYALIALGMAIQEQYSLSPPSEDFNSRLISAAVALVLWVVVMNGLGVGAARSLKRHFQPNRAFQVLASVALVGLGTGLVLRLVRAS